MSSILEGNQETLRGIEMKPVNLDSGGMQNSFPQGIIEARRIQYMESLGCRFSAKIFVLFRMLLLFLLPLCNALWMTITYSIKIKGFYKFPRAPHGIFRFHLTRRTKHPPHWVCWINQTLQLLTKFQCNWVISHGRVKSRQFLYDLNQPSRNISPISHSRNSFITPCI